MPTIPASPEIPEPLQHLWGAFSYLHRARPIVPEIGPRAIPASEILSECTLRGIVDLEFAARVIRALDSYYLDWVEEDRRKREKRKPKH